MKIKAKDTLVMVSTILNKLKVLEHLQETIEVISWEKYIGFS